MFRYGDASLASPVNRTVSLLPVRKAVLTPYQRKCYARMYRLRLAEKKRFTYKSAYLYEQIRKMHELQEEYLVAVKYDVKSYGDLFCLKLRLQQVDEELCKAQKEMYKERRRQKGACKTEEDMAAFETSGPEYHDKLERIKLQKKDNHKKLQAVERCLERAGSLAEAELELRIPVGDMKDTTEIDEDDVPANPYRVQKDVEAEDATWDETVKTGVMEANVIRASEHEKVVEMDKLLPVGADDKLELTQNDNQERQEEKLPANKAEYMRMSIAEKVRCYPFDTKGTDSAFEMVKDYFETVGLSTDFDSVYEEAKLLTDYYEEKKTKTLIQERTEQIIEKLDMLGIDVGNVKDIQTDVLSEAFEFEDMEYFAGIKLFNRVLDKLGIDMEKQERYEVFDKIYEERMQREQQENRSIR